MPERTFTIEMNEPERLVNLIVLGFVSANLSRDGGDRTGNQVPKVIVDSLILKCSQASGRDGEVPLHRGQGLVGAENAARAILAPPAEPRDYFQRDRKGKEQTNPPEGAEMRTVRIIQTQEMPGKEGGAPYLSVIVPKAKANCFDRQLWPFIVKRTGEEAALWFAKSGKFLNIVGVRA